MAHPRHQQRLEVVVVVLVGGCIRDRRHLTHGNLSLDLVVRWVNVVEIVGGDQQNSLLHLEALVDLGNKIGKQDLFVAFAVASNHVLLPNICSTKAQARHCNRLQICRCLHRFITAPYRPWQASWR
jgi:hypothetical protein